MNIPAVAVRLAENETLAKRVVGSDPELGSADGPRGAGDLGHDRGVWPDRRRSQHPATEDGADDALDPEARAVAQPATGVLDRDAGAHPGAGRRPVDLALGEDAHVPGVRTR